MTSHASQTDYVSCNLCGSDDSEVLFQEPDAQPSGRFGVVKCRGCGLVYRNVRAMDVRQIERRWREESDGISPDWVAARNSMFLPYLSLVDGFRQHSRILDVGAGYGFFLETCRKRGWKECHGVEISRTAAEYARDKLCLDVACAGIEEVDYPEGSFDVVTFWNVLGHLPDPLAAMRKAHRLLRPGGAVLMRVTAARFHIAARKLHRMLGCRFADPSVFHLYSFDKGPLTALIEKAGLADVEVKNSRLAWTTREGAAGSAAKTAACAVAYAMAQMIGFLSMNKMLVSPSLVAWAVKRETATDKTGMRVREYGSLGD